MKRYALVAIPALLAALLSPGIILADSPPAAGDAPASGHRFQERLGLTDDQMNAIREIWTRQRPAARQIWQALARARQELRQLALGGADDAAIQAKAAEIEGLHGQALQLRVAALREIAPLLSEEQRQKLAQMPERRWHRPPPAQG